MVYLASSMKQVVSDSSRNKSISGFMSVGDSNVPTGSGADVIAFLYVTEDRVDRQSHVVRTDLALKGIA